MPFMRAAKNAQYADFEHVPENKALLGYTYAELHLVPGGDASSRTLSDDLSFFVFARTLRGALTHNFVFGSRFFTQDTNIQNETFVHEVLHIQFDGNHRAIVKALLGIEGISEGTADSIFG